MRTETPNVVRVDFDFNGIIPILKAIHSYMNTRNLSDEKQKQEYELLLETYQRVQEAIRPFYK